MKVTLWWRWWNHNNVTVKAPQRCDCDDDTTTMWRWRWHCDGNDKTTTDTKATLQWRWWNSNQCEGDTAMATMKPWQMRRQHYDGDNETTTMRWWRWHHNSNDETTMTTPWQYNDKDNTVITTKLRQCDDEGDTTMAMMKPWWCDSKGNTTMTKTLQGDSGNDTAMMQWQHGHDATMTQLRCNNDMAVMQQWHGCDATMTWSQCNDNMAATWWQWWQHGNDAMMMMDRWIGSTMVAHMFLFYKQWKFVFNILYCNVKKKRIVWYNHSIS